jgi:predicted RNase H-like nuclease
MLKPRTGSLTSRVAGIDGAPGGWAVVITEVGRSSIRKIAKLSDLIDSFPQFEIIAVDIPIGLLDSYQVGGRECDRAARTLLREERGRSIFPVPLRCVLEVLNGPPLPIVEKHQEACRRSRGSGPQAKGISRQAFNILSKIREVDDLLHVRPELRPVIHEIHPELCFYELAGGKPMANSKASRLGKEERRAALGRAFPDLDVIEKAGRTQGLHVEDILDAAAACWSADRLAAGLGRSLPEVVPYDATGLPMAIWR